MKRTLHSIIAVAALALGGASATAPPAQAESGHGYYLGARALAMFGSYVYHGGRHHRPAFYGHGGYRSYGYRGHGFRGYGGYRYRHHGGHGFRGHGGHRFRHHGGHRFRHHGGHRSRHHGGHHGGRYGHR